VRLANISTIDALSGRIDVESDGTMWMGIEFFSQGEAYHVPNNAELSATALDDCRLMELSPPESGDVRGHHDYDGRA